MAKDGRRLMQWLKDEGIELVNLGSYGTNVLSPPWRVGFGLTWQNYGGDVALQRLEANFQKRQGRIMRGTRARALTLVYGGIEIEVEQADGVKKLSAPSVVIADGGFQANLDMLRQSGVSPAPEKLLARNGGTAVGDGLRMALGLGAAPSGGMNNFYGHLHNRDAMQSTKHWPRPVTDDLAAAGIVIDADGQALHRRGARRHLDLQRHRPPARSARHHDHLRPVRSGRARPAAITRSRPIRWWSKPAAPFIAPTRWRRSPAKIGLAPERLSDVVGEYNKAIEQGTLQKLEPPRGDAPNKAWPIKTAPFYAMPICAAITNTMGGIVVDGDARVLDLDDKPIAGLYAAGSTVGGLDGGPHAGYVGGLIKATIGLRAAETISRKA